MNVREVDRGGMGYMSPVVIDKYFPTHVFIVLIFNCVSVESTSILFVSSFWGFSSDSIWAVPLNPAGDFRPQTLFCPLVNSRVRP